MRRDPPLPGDYRESAATFHIREAIEKQLEKIGFGDSAQKRLIALLWKEVLGGNDKRWAAAARLLAEITQAAKANAQNEKIPTLRIGGLEEGLAAMLGPDAPTNETAHAILEEDVEIDDAATDSTRSPDATGYSTGD